MKKNIWKIILLAAYPYLYMIAFIIIFIIGAIEDSMTQDFEYTMLSIVILVGLALVITILCFVIALINLVKSARNSYGIQTPIKMNLLVKCIQIPAYSINFIVGFIGLAMSIWGIPFLFLAVVVDFLTIAITGTNNVGACLNLYKNRALTSVKTALFAILSYIYVVDVFVAIYLFVYVHKNRIENIEENNK